MAERKTIVIMASTQKVRRLVLTGAVTAITITGTLYGASVKMQQEVSEVWLKFYWDLSIEVLFRIAFTNMPYGI